MGQDGDAPTELAEADDDALLLAVSQGDKEAFGILMARHARSMLGLAGRVTRSPDEAEEIVQEAFLKVWKMASRWRTDRDAKFSTWLYRVVLNASLDRQRRARFTALEEAGDPADDAPHGVDQILTSQRHRLVAQAMDDVPSRQRAALSLHYFADLTAPQAARVLNLSVPAVESLLVRGKKALKAALVRRGITGLGDVT